jgi:hypothetical protein
LRLCCLVQFSLKFGNLAGFQSDNRCKTICIVICPCMKETI